MSPKRPPPEAGADHDGLRVLAELTCHLDRIGRCLGVLGLARAAAEIEGIARALDRIRGSLPARVGSTEGRLLSRPATASQPLRGVGGGVD